MEILVESKKFGNQTVLIDDEDYHLIENRKWTIVSNYKVLYARHSWKRGGEVGDISMHRIIMGVSDPNVSVDHKDGNGLNNRKSNLRLSSQSQNSMNRGMTIKNKSGYKGVIFEPKKKLYRVVITANKKVVRAGRFKNPIEAAKKYNELAIELHGDFAFLNKIPNE